MIPRILHLIWVGGNAMPPKYQECLAQIQKLHKETSMEIKLWGDSDIAQLECASIVHLSTNNAQKADIMRYEIIYRYGGVYLDIDVFLLKSLDSLITRFDDRNETLLICNEVEGPITDFCSIGFFAATPHHPILARCFNLETIVERMNLMKDKRVNFVTGPFYFGLTLCQEQEASREILHTRTFYPIPWAFNVSVTRNDVYAIQNRNDAADIWGIHLWGHLWK